MLKKCGIATENQDGQIVGQMYDEVMKRHKKGKLADAQQQDPINTNHNTSKEQQDLEEDDPIEERRKIFGEESIPSDEEGNSQGKEEEDEDEFMIVLQAVRERKKFEAEINRPLLKDKLS